MPKLTAAKVKSLREPGMYGDGGGLYLAVGEGRAKSWILRTTVYGRRREIGLGSASLVTLAEARDEAHRLRKIARAGGDPTGQRSREVLTFEKAAETVHALHLPTWKNDKHASSWLASIKLYAVPTIGARPIGTISTADIINVLQPIWTEKNETASRLKQRLATIFDWAKGNGHYAGENPVNGVAKALPLVKATSHHMAALPWAEVPALIRQLRQRSEISARTLEFIILTATRSGEARGARWDEIDFANSVWTIPRERMKLGVAHRIPLSTAAEAVLRRMRGFDSEFIFPSSHNAKQGGARPQSDMVFKPLYRRMQRNGFTTHGFRSSFRDWCSEHQHVEREVAEAALAHVTGSQVERAYARSDLFERRRELMQAWADYLDTPAEVSKSDDSVMIPPARGRRITAKRKPTRTPRPASNPGPKRT